MSVTNFYHAAMVWIEGNITSTSLKFLKQTRESLSSAYQSSRKKGFATEEERSTYFLSRFPATYHACRDVLGRLPSFSLSSSLDLGAGPGTATLALCDTYESSIQYVCIEGDGAMLSLGKRMHEDLGISSTWIQGDLMRTDYPPSDLVMLSYVLTEMPEKTQLEILQKAWHATQKVLVIISPGSKNYFADVLSWREILLSWGASIIAPCPSAKPCPMENTKDWCHFKARVQRTSAMRTLKSGTASYEDEPYSYLMITREPTTMPSNNRIITPPQKKGGHMMLNLCEDGEIRTHIIPKSDPRYKSAKKLELGDSLSE